MAFTLSSVVPWGRTFQEYQKMFLLDQTALSKKIADFGGGPSSFNCEASAQGCSVTSFDPVYQFTSGQLRKRIQETRAVVMGQMAENQDHYVWTDISSLEELEARRMSAMNLFLEDFEGGKAQRRYICHMLPNQLPLPDGTFDLGLSSHFLLMYTMLGYEFHIQSISEMLRVCKEVRIFPLLNLDGQDSQLISQVIDHFRKDYTVEIKPASYEFQKGGNQLLIIKH